jgi:hypothetical protein
MRQKTFAWLAGLVFYSIEASLPDIKELLLATAPIKYLVIKASG